MGYLAVKFARSVLIESIKKNCQQCWFIYVKYVVLKKSLVICWLIGLIWNLYPHHRSQRVTWTQSQLLILEVFGPKIVALSGLKHSKFQVDICYQLRAKVGLFSFADDLADPDFVAIVSHLCLIVQKQLREGQLIFFPDETIDIFL